MLAFFDVLSWGYGAYVDLRVTAPSGREIQKFEAESEGRVDFTATEDGEHNFCFLNAQTETEVSFWVNTESDSALSDVAKQGKLFILLTAVVFFSSIPIPILNPLLHSSNYRWYPFINFPDPPPSLRTLCRTC